ncbi:MAG: type II secretion system protein GspM, partial [Natronospirillum sp.]
WMQEMAPRVRANVALSGQTAATDSAQSMTNAISQAAQTHDLDLTRFEQSGEEGLRVWLDNQPFDDVLLWVAALETQGLRVDQMTISQTNQSGLVNVRGVYARQ